MAKREFLIGEISNILGISAPTLRFWQEKGLINIGTYANSYRLYHSTDLIKITDIIFYKKLGFSLKTIRKMMNASLPEYEQYLDTSEQRIEEKIEELYAMRKKLSSQHQNYLELQQLLAQPYQITDRIPFSCIIGWEFWEKEKLLHYIDDQTNYVWLKDTEHESRGRKGLIWSDSPSIDPQQNSVLWQKLVPDQNRSHQYIVFPVRAHEENDYEAVESAEIIAALQKKYRTGFYIARHLLTCYENGKATEYLKAYLEIREAL